MRTMMTIFGRLVILSTIIANTNGAEAGIYAQPNPWGSSQIQVCFDNKDQFTSTLSYNVDGRVVKSRSKLSAWTPVLMERVKDLINSEYSKEKTGVEFVGWTSCSESSFDGTQAHIFVSTANAKELARESEYGRSSIGNNIQFQNVEEKAPFVYFQHPLALAGDFKLKHRPGNADAYWEAVVIHEFGHLAGLLHEHEQPNFTKDPNCQIEFKGHIQDVMTSISGFSFVDLKEYLAEDDGSPGATNNRIQYGAYDPKSIMNYCYINRFRSDSAKAPIRMSEQDRMTLKEMYSIGN